ncbi:glycosyltransferase family 4 protein [Testudinibacter sp. TR-2022]|uniref:glycosyltransferase family 4 protein n=1 Tax=Testudinibacter sp. TR-2022 TaxID=2585029 RepID=UPI00111A9690|nr:glycosyltransferase family 1 protein [Testudinibacter sp. TR-2022]TNH06231.1 glycosyltransferase family 4 protein [Pasteurellaceae bacterium Phil11]TNH23146.1 glycosyltransferase family 4 protein [Testudinibacter sp. TR-2022]TNH25389.1 glycosyltransferase family 4 protein [Testudinibacter sp. TR-2022]
MKIMIDGHNLGLKEFTGIGVYASNLATNLQTLGHDISILYSMYSGSEKFPENIEFYQKLATEGEAASSGILKWAYHGFPYYLSQLFGKGLTPKKVQTNIQLINQGLNRKIPNGATPYNLPHFFRVSQAFSAISAKNLNVNLTGMDVLHLTLPLPISARGVKKVVTVHDLIPLKLPLSTSVNISHYANILKSSLKDADLIFTVSNQSKLDLIEIMNIPDEKIHVTYQSSFIPNNLLNLPQERIETVLENYNLKYKKYFIFYGAVEPKKNVLRLLQAFSKANTDCKLVVLGKNGWLYEQEEKFFDAQRYNQKYNQDAEKRFNPKIIRIPYSDFSEMMTLLKGANSLIFPSLYEGFGLPVLEAMQMGIPVITSNTSCLPEVAGNAAFYVDPYSIDDIINAIETLSSDNALLSKLSSLGLEQAQNFSEEKYQENLAAGYNLLK